MNDSRAASLPAGDAAVEPDEFVLSALLFPGDPADVLERIVPGDPLELCALSARILSERAVFLDPRHVARRVFALVACGAVAWRGKPRLAAWLEARCQLAVDELLQEESDRSACAIPMVSREPAACPTDAPRERRCAGSTSFQAESLARPLGLNTRALELACARFHALPLEDRRAFCAIVLPGSHSVQAFRVAEEAERGPEGNGSPLAPGASRVGAQQRSPATIGTRADGSSEWTRARRALETLCCTSLSEPEPDPTR